MKTSWRRLLSSSSEDVFNPSSRRLGQNEYVCLSLESSEDAFKTSSRRLGQDQYIRLGHRSSRYLQDVFKTSWQDVFKTFSRRLVFKTSWRPHWDVFKTSARRFKDVFKTSSRYLQDVMQRHLHDVFKAYHQVNLFLLTHPLEVFNTFLRRSFPKTAIYKGICLGNTTSEKFIISVQNLQER